MGIFLKLKMTLWLVICPILETQERGAGGEIQLTDAMHTLRETQPFFGLEFDGEDFDCGSRTGYAEAFLAYALKDKECGANIKEIVSGLIGHDN